MTDSRQHPANGPPCRSGGGRRCLSPLRAAGFLLPATLFCLAVMTGSAAAFPDQVGVGYGADLRSKADLEQYEVFLRTPMRFSDSLRGVEITTSLEYGLGLIRPSGGSGSDTARFSIMPQAVLRPWRRLHFLAGLGAGLMAGDTDIAGRSLGGPFFFSAKLGAQLHLSDRWILEYTFYHQSNGHLYSDNYGLDINQFALVYQF